MLESTLFLWIFVFVNQSSGTTEMICGECLEMTASENIALLKKDSQVTVFRNPKWYRTAVSPTQPACPSLSASTVACPTFLYKSFYSPPS